MDIHDAVAGVRSYDHKLGKEQPAQKHLWQIPKNPPAEFPVGLRIRVSGSGHSLPVVPWIALLDEDVTITATDGLYLCYLYTAQMDAVYLSMNQGATQHRRLADSRGLRNTAADKAAVEEIQEETLALRELVRSSMPSASSLEIDLGASHFLPSAYEAGSIAAIRYDIKDLPHPSELGADLEEFVAFYAACVGVKDELAAKQQVRTSARSEKLRARNQEAPPEFKPKNAEDYFARVSASTQRRTRTHEALIRTFGEEVLAAGRSAITNVHPRDLIVADGRTEWLVEAKTVGMNAEQAVRAAIGQLYSYRHFYYRETHKSDPRLLALFDAPIGKAFEELLQSLGIDFVYRSGGRWHGSPGGSGLLAKN